MSDPGLRLSPLVASAGREAADGRGASSEDALVLALEAPLDELLFAAGRVRQAHFGNRIECCSIVNARSGHCTEDCKFCAQSGRYQTGADSFGLVDDESVRGAARDAKKNGASGLGLVTSGCSLGADDIEEVCGRLAVLASLAEEGPEPHASLGMLDVSVARRLAGAGVRVYNHNLETSRSHFPQICTSHDYDARLATLEAVREAGMERCSGGIFGVGESWPQRIELAAELARLGVERVPINFLVPVPGTPLEQRELLPAREALRIVAVFRLMLPAARIQVCGGRERVLGPLQSMIFAAGATGVILGNYLTTAGRPVEEDLAMFRDLGLELES